MAAKERTLLFLEKLARATREGRLCWERTADEQTFRAALENGMIQVSGPPNPSKGLVPLFRYAIFDRNNAPMQGGDALEGVQNSPLSQVLAELYNSALQSALTPDDWLGPLDREIDARLASPPPFTSSRL
jgi:hypothetical protein